MARAVIYDVADSLTVQGADCSPENPDSGVAVFYLGQPAYALTDTSDVNNQLTIVLRGIVRLSQDDIDGTIAFGNNIEINPSTGALNAVPVGTSLTEQFYGVIFAVDAAATVDVRLGGLPNATDPQFAF